jgi:hypothetical protein
MFIIFNSIFQYFFCNFLISKIERIDRKQKNQKIVYKFKIFPGFEIKRITIFTPFDKQQNSVQSMLIHFIHV